MTFLRHQIIWLRGREPETKAETAASKEEPPSSSWATPSTCFAMPLNNFSTVSEESWICSTTRTGNFMIQMGSKIMLLLHEAVSRANKGIWMQESKIQEPACKGPTIRLCRYLDKETLGMSQARQADQAWQGLVDSGYSHCLSRASHRLLLLLQGRWREGRAMLGRVPRLKEGFCRCQIRYTVRNKCIRGLTIRRYIILNHKDYCHKQWWTWWRLLQAYQVLA